MFHPFEVTIPHIVYTCLGGFVVLFGMFSLFLREKLYIGEACWAFLFGVIIGPYGAGIFDPRAWGGSEDATNIITLEFTRVVLAIGVFAIGVELPKAYMARHWKSIFFLLVPVMTWGWFVSAGLIYAFIPGLNFLSSLAVAACLTPTDPILAAAVVGGKWADKHVPAHIRHLLAAESGCNDGAAFPFLFISLYLLLDTPDVGAAIRDWFLILWLYQVTLGIVFGALIGFGFRHLMKFCQRHDLIDRHSYVAQYVSLAMLTIGVTTLLGSDDLLAAFACGTAFAWDGFFNRQTEESVFSSVIDLLFNVAAFVFVGAWMPFSSFTNEELTLSVWRLIVIAILVLLLRRLPVMVALYRWIPDVKTFREAVFSGHFGPIGIGAIFISTLAAEIIHKDKHLHGPQVEMLYDTIQPIVAFMVLCSITIHGLSIPSFSLGRRVHSVSRTWSRHAPPDWTNQARLVSRGDSNIVINRDSLMERGQLGADEKTLAQESSSSSPRPDTTPLNADDRGSFETKLADSVNREEQMTQQGDEEVVEWQEPHHKVIERRRSSVEDVDVEVTNDEDPNQDGISSKIRHSLHRMDSLKRLARTLEHKAGEDVQKEVKAIGVQIQGIRETVNEALELSPNSPQKSVNTPTTPSVINTGEDEEGWTSDRSQSNSSIVTDPSDQKKRPKVFRVRVTSHGSGRRGRTRNSLRRGQGHPVAHAGENAIADTAQVRGRPATAPPSATRPPDPGSASGSRPSSSGHASRPSTADSIMRHQRLDRLRALHSSPSPRDVSPARSVRFKDEMLAIDVLPRPSAEVMNDDLDSAKNKVTFDVPRSPNSKA